MKYILILILFCLVISDSFAQKKQVPILTKMTSQGVAKVYTSSNKSEPHISPRLQKQFSPIVRSLSKTSNYYLINNPNSSESKRVVKWFGKELNKKVLMINTPKFINNYIGETEKNLSKLFKEAKVGGWILFFDEADALFGKRTNVKDSHDRYANQQVSYLFEKIKEQNVVVFVSMKKTNPEVKKAFRSHILTFDDDE